MFGIAKRNAVSGGPNESLPTKMVDYIFEVMTQAEEANRKDSEKSMILNECSDVLSIWKKNKEWVVDTKKKPKVVENWIDGSDMKINKHKV